MATPNETELELDAATAAELEQSLAEDLEPGPVEPSPTPAPVGIPNTPTNIGRFARSRGMRVNEPARPDLQAGESITTEPNRFCERCEEPRAAKRCPICKTFTVPNGEMEDAPEYEPAPFVRERELSQAHVRIERERVEPRRPALTEAQLEQARAFFGIDEEQPEMRQAAGAGSSRTATTQGRFARANVARRSRGEDMRQRHQQGRANLRAVDDDPDEYDDRGDRVQRTPSRRNRGGRGGRNVRSAEDELELQWRSGQVITALWYQGYAALLQGCETLEDVEQAATLADAAYIEMMARQRP